MKKCLDHMRRAHSFFVLDVDCVTSLKGLLTYIAERVQLGYLCLFCSKMFRNARRCQQHMMDKSHCFMNVDDEHEYQQYYDFSKTYEGVIDEATQEVLQRPLLTQKPTTEDKQGDDWEDVDVEDENEEDQEEGEAEDAKQESAFSIITEEPV